MYSNGCLAHRRYYGSAWQTDVAEQSGDVRPQCLCAIQKAHSHAGTVLVDQNKCQSIIPIYTYLLKPTVRLLRAVELGLKRPDNNLHAMSTMASPFPTCTTKSTSEHPSQQNVSLLHLSGFTNPFNYGTSTPTPSSAAGATANKWRGWVTRLPNDCKNGWCQVCSWASGTWKSNSCLFAAWGYNDFWKEPQFWTELRYAACFSANPLKKKSQTFFGQKWARGPSFLCRKAPTAHFCIPFAVGLALCMLCCRTTGLSTGLCGLDRLSVRWGSCLAARPCQPARGKWIRSSSDSSFIWQGARHQPAPLKVQLPASDVKCLQKIQAFGCRRKAVLHIRTLPSACFPWTDCCYLLCNEKADMNVYSARDSTAAEHKLQALNVGNHFTPH